MPLYESGTGVARLRNRLLETIVSDRHAEDMSWLYLSILEEVGRRPDVYSWAIVEPEGPRRRRVSDYIALYWRG
jgi:hypothetical protein